MRASARLSVRELTEADYAIYDRVLPKKSLLLDSLEFIDWNRFDESLRACYKNSGEGQPPYPPLILLKMEFLLYLHGISQRECVERCQSDLHWKYFLQLPVDAQIVDQSTITVFRQRLGIETYAALFDLLLGTARGYGLVADKLRLKDATHIIGDVAVPSALGLFAQLRQRMLQIVEQIDPDAAAMFASQMQTVRQETEGQDDIIRLQNRVAFVQDMLDWMRQVPQPTPSGDPKADGAALKVFEKLQATIALASKILGDAANPTGGDKVRSVVDPDVRKGKHGDFYDGFSLDVMMDAESELITAIELLPANGQEAANAIKLIEHEEQTHGNQIEQLSIDGIGFNGEVLHELECPGGPEVDVYTPPTEFSRSEGFSVTEFQMVEDGNRVVCPAGKTSGPKRTVDDKPNSSFYQFSRKQCWDCPLRPACCPKMTTPKKAGRQVNKNRYEADYERARAKASTAAYAEIRRRHPAIERKLNEIVRHHRGRRARYRGWAKVKVQQLMIAFAINVKRMRKLLSGQLAEFALLN